MATCSKQRLNQDLGKYLNPICAHFRTINNSSGTGLRRYHSMDRGLVKAVAIGSTET